MKKGTMEVRVVNSKLVVVLVAILITVMSGGMASGLECLDCHFGNGISTIGLKQCPGGDDQKDCNLFLVKTEDNGRLARLSQVALATNTYYVPNDFSTIQEAIDAAVDGNEIIVRDGTYIENIDFSGKAITVRSEHGPVTTIIEGVYDLTAVVSFWNSEGADSVLDGFTITNGHGGFGGGISSLASEPTISNCIITGNTASGWGGGIFLCDLHGVDTAATITNCVITNNTSGEPGGGIYCGGTSPIITNCTISSNSAYTVLDGGGIRSSIGASPTVVNSILWRNTVDGIPNEISVSEGSSIDITYSDVEGGWTGNDNIDCNPEFVGDGDYHLAASSCCVDAGTSVGAPGEDIDGDPRPQRAACDVGADEFPNQPPIAVAEVSPSVEYIIGEAVNLDGSQSSDADGDTLTYTWSFVSKPEGSLSAIADPTSVQTTFTPDLPGDYVVRLVVNDGFVDSDPSDVTIDEVAVKMELPKGWSMISLPVTPVVSALTTLFPDAEVVYKYQKGVGYVRVTGGETLEDGLGYWILLNNPRSYVIRGTAITEYTMPVADGWYMIGGCILPTDKMVTTGSIDVIYEYTQGSGYTWVPESESLKRGKGYWILFSNTSQGAAFTASSSVSE